MTNKTLKFSKKNKIHLGNQYKIIVYTGNKRGAGTDADVSITLFGEFGESGAILLDDKKNNFESGQYVNQKSNNILLLFCCFFVS